MCLNCFLFGVILYVAVTSNSATLAAPIVLPQRPRRLQRPRRTRLWLPQPSKLKADVCIPYHNCELRPDVLFICLSILRRPARGRAVLCLVPRVKISLRPSRHFRMLHRFNLHLILAICMFQSDVFLPFFAPTNFSSPKFPQVHFAPPPVWPYFPLHRGSHFSAHSRTPAASSAEYLRGNTIQNDQGSIAPHNG